MAVNLGSAYGKVSLDVKGVVNGVASAKGAINSLAESGARLKALGTALTLAVSLPLLAVGKNALMAASAMNETKNKVKVVFKEMSDAVLEWSENSAMAFGQSQQQALAAAATFGNLFVTMDIGVEKASEMSMALVQLASDMSSFNDIDPSVALEKLRAGLVGEIEPLRTTGIVLSEVEVNAYALRMGLVDMEVDMVGVNGATLDLRVAQDELAKAMRGGVPDTDKLSNAQNRLSDASGRVADAQSRVAKAQLAVQRAQRDLAALLADPKIEKDSLRIVHAQERVADAEQRVAEAQGKVADAQGKVTQASLKLSDARQTEAPDALDIAKAEQKVAEAQQNLQNSMGGTNVELTNQQKLLARYGLIMEQSAIQQGDFSRTAFDFANSLRSLQAVWGNTLVKIGDVFLPIATKVVHWLTKMLDAFNKLTPFQQKMIVVFVTLVAVIGPLLIALGFLLPMLGRVTKHTSFLSGGIVGLVGSFLKLLSIAAVVVTVLEYFGVATGAVGAGILGLSGALGAAAAAVFTSVILPILIVIGFIYLLYYVWKKNLFGIQELVAKSAAGYRLAWARFTSWWKENSAEAAENVRSTFAQLPGTISNSFQNIVKSVSGAWTNFVNWLRNALTSMRTYISTAFTNMNWSQVGKYILLGIANGLLFGLPSLLAIVVKVAQSVLAQIKKSLGISSPSKEAFKLGAFTAQGFALGMQTMSPDAIARSLTKPITQNSSSQSQTIIQNFAGGVTLKEVRGLIAASHEELVGTMLGALGG
jgi:hypothetical protein